MSEPINNEVDIEALRVDASKGSRSSSKYNPGVCERYREEILRKVKIEGQSVAEVVRWLNETHNLNLKYITVYMWIKKVKRAQQYKRIIEDGTKKEFEVVDSNEPMLDKLLEDYARICQLSLDEFRDNPDLFRMATRGAEIVFNMKRARMEAASRAAFLRQRRKEKQQEAEHQQQRLALMREKFEFSASEKALKYAADLKLIGADSTLTMNQKVQAVRLKIFGNAA